MALASSFEPNGKGPCGLTCHKYNNKGFYAQGLLQESGCFFEIIVILCDFGDYFAQLAGILPNKREVKRILAKLT